MTKSFRDTTYARLPELFTEVMDTFIEYAPKIKGLVISKKINEEVVPKLQLLKQLKRLALNFTFTYRERHIMAEWPTLENLDDVQLRFMMDNSKEEQELVQNFLLKFPNITSLDIYLKCGLDPDNMIDYDVIFGSMPPNLTKLEVTITINTNTPNRETRRMYDARRKRKFIDPRLIIKNCRNLERLGGIFESNLGDYELLYREIPSLKYIKKTIQSPEEKLLSRRSLVQL